MKAKKIKIILAVSAIIVLVFVSFVLLRKYPFFADITSGKLVLSYDFQTITDGKIIDGSGNTPSLNGIMHGGTIVDENEAPVLQLNGTSDYLEVPSSDLLSSNSTKEMSFKISFRSDDYGTNQTLLSRSKPCNNGHFNIFIKDSALYFSYYSDIDKKTGTISTSAILENGRNYEVYMLKKWGEVGSKLYINGVQVQINGDDNFAATTYTDLPTLIGARNVGATACGTSPDPYNFFKGTIKEVKIWNKFLTQDEIDNLTASSKIEILSGNVKLVVNSSADVNSLQYSGSELLAPDKHVLPISSLKMKNGSTNLPISFTKTGDDLYDIGYINSDVITKIKITPETNDRIIFSLTAQTGSVADIESVNILDFSNARHIAQSASETEWAKNAPETEPFIVSLPLNDSTVCLSDNYVCYGAQVLGITNAQAALIITPKNNYFAAIEKLIDDKNLPKVMVDNKWFRKNSSIGDSYLFTTLTSSNASSLLDQAKKSGFKQILLQTPVVAGHYDQPIPHSNFKDQEDFYNAVDQFTQNGIKVGIHTFIGRVSPSDSLFNPPSQNLQKVSMGTITNSLGSSTSNTEILTSENVGENVEYKYFSTVFYSPTKNYFLIDDEVMQCTVPTPQTSPPKLICNRGYGNWTPKAAHAAGSPLYLLPNEIGFFIDYNNKAVFDQSVASFKAMAERLKVDFFYFDGYSGIPTTNDYSIRGAYAEKNSLQPYIKALTNKPIYQTGTAQGSFSYYFSKRRASWDALTFNVKNFTKDFKVARYMSTSQNPYIQRKFEMGWWKIFGTQLDLSSQFQGDIEATTLDDIHYAMTKIVAFSSSMGLQLGSYFEKLNNPNILYSIFNRYESLLEKQKSSSFIPQNILEYLKGLDHEAELTDTPGYQFVEKQMTNKFITSDTKIFNLNNKFGAQKLKIAIRPQPDYKGFNDVNNTLISNFSDASVKGTSSDKVECTITNGQVTIANNETNRLGSCKIGLPNIFNLSNKRGVGLQMTGDGKKEMIVVNLNDGVLRRDFPTTVNFSDQKTLILGAPTTSLTDTIDDLSTNYGITQYRQSGFDYTSSSITAQIYIHTKPGDSYTLKFDSLKALTEKDSSTLKNPAIEIAGKKITFPVSLSYNDTDPNILEYNGYSRTYKLYSSNYAPLGEGVINDDNIEVASGSNQVTFSNDEDASNAQLANLKVTVNADEDNDGVPTNGNYSDESKPCSSSGNFCDDNRPTFYNPKQNLSPIIESVNVTDGQVISENPYIVSAKVSDVAQIAKVEFYVDDNLIGTSTLPDISGSYDAVWDTSKYHSTVKVVAYDTTGSKTEISRSAQIPSSASSIDNDQIVTILPKTGWRSWFDSIYNQVSEYLDTIF